MRNHDYSSTKVCVIGRSGRGKSTYARKLLVEWKAGLKFAFDHKDELKNKAGFQQARNSAEAGAALMQTRSICWKPNGPLRPALSHWLAATFNICKRLPGSKLIHFDEPNLTLPQHKSAPETGSDFWHPFQAVMETGREFGVDVLVTAQRANHLHPDFRGQVTRWVIFQTSAGWQKTLADDYGRDFSAATDLPLGWFITYDVEADEISPPQTFKP